MVEIIVLTEILYKPTLAEVYVPDRTIKVTEEDYEKMMSHPSNFNYKGGRFKYPVSMKQNGDEAMVMLTGIYKMGSLPDTGPPERTLCIRKGE